MPDISSEARKKVNDAVVISGSARSGTTIVGKIIHSFASVEYAFEPPMLFSLLPLIDKMPEDQWRLLYETCLYEDFFIGAVCGRSINCNRKDDSSVYRVKSEEEIERRLSISTGKAEAQISASGSVIAYKMPSVAYLLPRLVKYYPGTRVVIVNREPVETINSLLRKEWFTNGNAARNLIWPFTWYREIQIPFWVREEDFSDWYDMSAPDRCAYYYLATVRGAESLPDKIEVNYRRLLENPEETAKNLAGSLGLSFGPKTPEILAGVKPTAAKRDPAILNKIDTSLRDQILSVTGDY